MSRPNKGGRGLGEETKKERARVAYEDQTKEERALILEKKEEKTNQIGYFLEKLCSLF